MPARTVADVAPELRNAAISASFACRCGMPNSISPPRIVWPRVSSSDVIPRVRLPIAASVAEKFASVDLHPSKVPNSEMGSIFEELIRKFAELSNETAGEHFTPREVIRLMVNILFAEDDDALSRPGVVKALAHRGGLRADILTDGEIRVGDAIEAAAPPS